MCSRRGRRDRRPRVFRRAFGWVPLPRDVDSATSFGIIQEMPPVQLYVVTSAVLVKVEGGSRWKITFEPKDAAQGDGRAEQAVVSSDKIDYLFFDATYTLGQIQALEDED